MKIPKSPSRIRVATIVAVVIMVSLFASSVNAQEKISKALTASASKTARTTKTLKYTNNTWLQFRGPNGSGVAEGSAPPAEFGANKNLAWKTAVPFARSSPVVTADKIFLTASEGEKLITLALDRKTGKILWRREVPRTRHMPYERANVF